MPRFAKSSRTSPSAPAGLKTTLRESARQRRETQGKLTELGQRESPVPALARAPQQILSVPVDSLKPANRKIRRDDAVQQRRLELSVTEFGQCGAILIDDEGRIIHGHGVWEAARRSGLTKVDVIVVSHLSPVQRRKLAIALNRLGETGQWDVEALRLEIDEILHLGEDLVVTGFEPAEIDALLVLEDEGACSEDDELLAAGSVAVSREGDLWALGPHKLFQGDARVTENLSRLMQGEVARVVFTDPPYNVPIAGHVTGGLHREFAMGSGEMSRDQFVEFNRAWMKAGLEHLADGGLLLSYIDWRSVEIILACGRDIGLALLNLVVWSKSNAGQGSLWRSQHELLPVFKKGAAPHVNNVELGRFGRWRSNVWTYPGGSSLGSDSRAGLARHPTVKPRVMLEDALLDVTDRDDIVLEPFSGSGSMILAAEKTGRICRAVEIDGPYCDLAIERWQDLTGLEATLVDTGDTFAAVRERRLAGSDRHSGPAGIGETV